MRVGVDLDNVLYPFVPVLAKYISNTTKRPIEELPNENCWNFWSEQWGYTLEQFLEFYKESVNIGYMFRRGAPIEGSLDALNELKGAGHTIHLVTDRAVGSIPQGSTEVWLRYHKIPFDSITYSPDKTVVIADVFIDDKPAHIEALRAAGSKAFLYDYGRKDQAAFNPRRWVVRTWPEFVEKVEQADDLS